jgi:hypothetical protein
LKLAALALTVTFTTAAFRQGSRYDELANQPFANGFLSTDAIAALEDEKTLQRAVQAYTWIVLSYRFPLSRRAYHELS